MLPETNEYRYEFMMLDRIREVLKECPVAIQPAGLLEWHGEHSAIGLDGTKQRYICERTIMLLGNGALMPVDWIGTYGRSRMEGTVCYSETVAQEVFFQTFAELIKIGFRVIAVMTGHYGNFQMNTLNSAKERAEKFAKDNNINIRIIAVRPPDMIPNVKFAKHAGWTETSMFWRMGEAIGIKTIDIDKAKLGEEKVPLYDISFNKGNIPFKDTNIWNWESALKDPKMCSAKIGEKLISGIAHNFAIEILNKLKELGIDYTPPEKIKPSNLTIN